MHDVDDAVLAQRELAWLAGHDQLTGLLNRRGMQEATERAQASHGAAPCGVVLCDVDHFKDINDELGHAAGDTVLRLVADALAGAAGPGRLVARLGGDEFIVISWTDTHGLEADLRRSVAGLQRESNARPVRVTTGRADRASAQESLACLVERADAAMYACRRQRRANSGG